MKRFLSPRNIWTAAPGQPHGLAHGRVFKRLLIGSQIGADRDGNLPQSFEAQAELAFDNLLAVVEAAQLTAGDIVKITAYSSVPGLRAQYNLVRERKIVSATPISSYIEIAALGDPNWLISIEGEAVQDEGV